MSTNLFDEGEIPGHGEPLASRMRPKNFDEYVGQEHLTAPDTPFRIAAESGKLGSVIFWGPPGVGKTTLAEIVARAAGANIQKLSATASGVADLRKVTDEARKVKQAGGKTVLFIDEIHRFNKSQQDTILPIVEDGTVSLIGATTENPSFEVNSALLSRSRVYILNALTDEDIEKVLDRALTSEKGVSVNLTPEAKKAIIGMANGDARVALNLLEVVSGFAEKGEVGLEVVEGIAQRQNILYDKNGEMHYDLISALHKSVRGSDVNASIYWLSRMLEAGEDPKFLARRLIRMASEDIGLADPQALVVAVAAQQAVHFIGMPEGALSLVEAAAYLAAAPKSNSIYVAYKEANKDIKEFGNLPVPMHLRNAPTKLMKDIGYGKGYEYAHDNPDAKVSHAHLPEEIVNRNYYRPTSRGWEGRRLAPKPPEDSGNK